MKVSDTFDYEKYIQERLREIDDIEERKFAKTLLLDGLGKMFDTIEDKYSRLEERISREIEPEGDRYEIGTTIIPAAAYDPLNVSLFPVCLGDIEDNNTDFTIYLEADDRLCEKFLRSGTITGTARQDGQEVTFHITKSKRYGEILSEIYRLFISNQIPWNTIHTGYLERFFDLTAIEPKESAKADSPKVSGQKAPGAEELFAFNWGEWAPYVRREMIPLWNIKTQYYEVSNFMVPCVDKLYYEYPISIEKPEERGYLFEIGENIQNIIIERNRAIVQSESEEVGTIKAYVIHQLDHRQQLPEKSSYQYDSPIITNRVRGSFCARYLQKSGIFLQTGADLFRKVAALSGDYEITVNRYEFCDEVPDLKGVLYADMNHFIKAEAFPYEKRRVFVLYFTDRPAQDCYYQAQIRFILSQLQQEYLEYKCVGVLR